MTLNQVYFSPLSHPSVPQSSRHPAQESKDIGGWIKRCTLVSQRTRDHKHKNLNNSRQGVMQPSAILVMVELTVCLFFLHCLERRRNAEPICHFPELYKRYQHRPRGHCCSALKARKGAVNPMTKELRLELHISGGDVKTGAGILTQSVK